MASNLVERFLSNFTFYQRLKNGTHRYLYLDSKASWDSITDKLKCGYENPVLLPILQLIAFYTSKVEFKVQDINTKEFEADHPIIDRLNNPNFYQSKQDFLRQFVWLKYCIGYTYIYPVLPETYSDAKDVIALFNLDASLVKFPDKFKTKFVYLNQDVKNEKESIFKYDKECQNLDLTVSDIIPFFDLPNGLLSKNLLTAPSRLDALKKPLTNIARSFDAKNIAIQTNGKELFRNRSGSQMQSVPLGDNEKQEIKDITNNAYGLATNRSRSIITNADIEWQSLHINLKDLGLDDSVVKDAQMCVSAFNIPKELISYDGKGAKYENQVQATIGFIQGVIQDNADDIANSFNSQFDLRKKEGKEIIASFDHLPIMQAVKQKKTESKKIQVEVLQGLLDAGVSTEDALREAGFEGLKLIPKS